MKLQLSFKKIRFAAVSKEGFQPFQITLVLVQKDGLS